MQLNTLHFGNNIEVLETFPPNSIDAIITDSPYGLSKEPDAIKCLQDWIDHGYHEVKGSGFMGKHWDAFVPQPVLWKECFRVLKPGGHLLSFFGTRTYDWGTLAIRLAGFEIRDCVMWIYGSGFPKSLDISKAIDKAAGAEREKVKIFNAHNNKGSQNSRPFIEAAKEKGYHEIDGVDPITDAAKQWNGYGTALKPACEPICVARKPLESTVIENVLQYGTGGINVDAGRVELIGKNDPRLNSAGSWKTDKAGKNVYSAGLSGKEIGSSPLGRWPANIIHDGSDEVLAGFPDAARQAGSPKKTTHKNGMFGIGTPGRIYKEDNNSSARFFYCAKTSPAERAERKHPTIKPLALMEYLVKVFCPAGGIVLDPFIGSGTTAIACNNTGHKWIGIEADPANYAEAKNFIYAGL